MEYTREHPLRVVTLCSGYDSQCMALDRLKELHPEFDYELIAWSEILDAMGISTCIHCQSNNLATKIIWHEESLHSQPERE